jgi:predicted TIM-barrel fold metal-dependent hydrolase
MFAKQLKGGNVKGISLLDDNGTLKDAVKEIIDIIAKAGIVLATGHISVEEAMVLIDGAKRGGVEKIVVTHPTSPMEHYTIDQMREAISRGASMLEHVVNDTTHQMKNPIPSTVISDAIKAAGAAHTIMSTDSGQVINPAPVTSLENFICMMLQDGIPEQDIRVMTTDNPAKMLGIDAAQQNGANG